MGARGFVPVRALPHLHMPRARALASSQLTRCDPPPRPSSAGFRTAVLQRRNDPSTVSASPPACDARHASLRRTESMSVSARASSAPAPSAVAAAGPAFSNTSSRRARGGQLRHAGTMGGGAGSSRAAPSPLSCFCLHSEVPVPMRCCLYICTSTLFAL